MESVLGRYHNLIVLVGVLFIQVLGLAIQVKRTTDTDSSRLIRVWAVGTVSPLEKTLVWGQTSTRNIWHNYFYLRGVRAENRDLKQQIEQMRIEQVRMSQDADQARRLQALLAFREQYISQTKAAQVIGSSGSEQSRSIYIDKGEKDGIRPDMAVITAEGVVGKVLHVYGSTSLVLLISDQTSGVGAILEKSRLQGIMRGLASGEIALERVMSDEQVPTGELVVTSGGDRIFPKGLPIGRVSKVYPGSDLFLNIHVKPSADLSKLEEVLVVTKIDERQATPDQTGPVRAADILAERLPSAPPPKPPDAAKGTGVSQPGAVPAQKPAATANNGTAPVGAAHPAPGTAPSGKPKNPAATGDSVAGSVTPKKATPPAQSNANREPGANASEQSVSPQLQKSPEQPKPQPPPQDTPQ